MEPLRGVVHGRMIELENEPGLPDGLSVTVMVQPAKAVVERDSGSQPGAGLRHAFGAWAEDAKELDDYLEWNRRQRRMVRTEIEP
jgi:hypothetical protein